MRRFFFAAPLSLFIASAGLAEPVFDQTGVGPFHAAPPAAAVAIARDAAHMLRQDVVWRGAGHADLRPGPLSHGLDLVEVQMRTEADAPDGSDAFIGAHGLRLAASFTGTLPCADCEGIAHHLDLWPDQTYHMRRVWLGGEGDNQRDEIGRWFADPSRDAIVLVGASEMPLQWQVMASDRLRQLDMSGNPIESDLNYELISDGGLHLTDLEGMFLAGMLTMMPEAAAFLDCMTGRSYPVSNEGAYGTLSDAYGAESLAPGEALYSRVEGALVMRPVEGAEDRRSLVVDRVIETDSQSECDVPARTAMLTDTYWRIDTLLGAPVPTAPDIREPYMVFFEGTDPMFHATVGCNQLSGGYEIEADALAFGAAGMTRMACPEPLGAAEQRLQEVIGQAQSFENDGATLTLRGEDGAPIATLSAVYYP